MVSGNLIWSLFLSGKHTRTVVHNKQTTSISVSNSGFSFIYHTTNGWIRGGYLECIYNRAGIRYRRLVFFWPFFLPSSIFWFIHNKKKTNTQQCTTLGQVRDRNFWILDIPGTFFLFFLFFRHRGFLGRYPYPHTRSTTGSLGFNRSTNSHSQQTLSLRLFPWPCSRITTTIIF